MVLTDSVVVLTDNVVVLLTVLWCCVTDKLDGIRAAKKKQEEHPQRLEDYLQLPDDYDSRTSQPGQKRVRHWL